MLRRFLLCLIIAFLPIVAFAATYGVSDVPNVHVADRSRYVSNPDGILSAATVQRLDSMLSALQRSTTAEVAVVVVESIDGDIDTFGTELFGKWGIGKNDNDNGLLFLVSKDDRKMVIRTGYGLEGVVPDVLGGRLIRNVAAPRFREGDYDGGVFATVSEINNLVTNPDVAGEIMSKYGVEKPRRNSDDMSGRDLFNMWIGAGVVMAIVLLCIYFSIMHKTRREDRFNRYQALAKMELPALIMSFLGIGIPFIVFFILLLTMRRLRTKRRLCPNCHHKMRRLDEQTDNQYLTPAQDAEERLNSVDYDVWLCDNCGEVDILPYVNRSVNYKVCQRCGARAAVLASERIVQRPTYRSDGIAIKDYVCRNCGHHNPEQHKIPKLPPEAPIIIGGIGGAGRGFGGGGGFSGGSFGGGMTGGGGASGGW